MQLYKICTIPYHEPSTPNSPLFLHSNAIYIFPSKPIINFMNVITANDIITH